MKRILHLSDPHFGAVDEGIAAAFLKTAAALQPDLTILSGDLTMRARWSELSAAKTFYEGLPSPRLLIPGNHDIPGYQPFSDRFHHPFRRFQETFGADLEPEWIGDGVHVVSMNSSRGWGFYLDWSEGRLSSRQLADMRSHFEKGPANHLRIVVLHHPLLELQLSGRAVVRPLKKLLDALAAARVDIVMCGHFHRSQILLAGSTDAWKSIISQAPTVSSTRLQGEPQGFHAFEIEGNHITVTHHLWDKVAFQTGRRARFARAANGWGEAALTAGD